MINRKYRFTALAVTIAGVLASGSLLLGGSSGCGKGGPGGDGVSGQFKGVDVKSTETKGALAIGGNVDINEDGNIVMRLNAIPNPDNPDTPYAEDELKFTESFTEDDSVALIVDGQKSQVNFNCTTDSTGSVSTPADIVFVLDTTGSMQPVIDGVKSSIIEFANVVNDTLDVRFAMVTFGDDVNDSAAGRPLQDFTDASTLQTFIDNNVFAVGGVDFPENALGALDCARVGGACNLSFRTGAQRMFVVITDASAHAKEGDATKCGADTVTPLPPSVSELKTSMGGDSVFTITNLTSGGDLSATDGCVSPGVELPINGGINIDLPESGNLNLASDIPLTTFIAGGYVMTCIPPQICGHGFPSTNGFLECTATDSAGRTGTIIWGVTFECLD